MPPGEDAGATTTKAMNAAAIAVAVAATTAIRRRARATARRPLGRNTAEDALRERGRGLGEAADDVRHVGERKRLRDRRQFPQLGPALGAAVEMGAQREHLGGVAPAERHRTEGGAHLAARIRRHRTNPAPRARAASP